MDKPLTRQIWVVSGVLLTMLEVGMFLGFTSTLLPALKNTESDIHVDVDQSSWIAASFSFAWIPGFFMSSILMDRFGRRIAFFVDIIPGGIGLLLMYFATNVQSVIAARILEGLTAGSTAVLGAIVVGEYTSPTHRGMFLNMKTAAVYAGSTIVHVLGNYFHWRTVALITLVPFLINLGMIWTWPESPAWLCSKKQFDKSSIIFYKLRGKNAQATEEVAEMIKTQQSKTKTENNSFLSNATAFFRKFGRRDFIMPVVIYVFAAILLETSGRHVFPAYAIQIISEISGKYDPFYMTLCLDILVTISALFSSALVRMAKRRTLLFSTGLLSFIVLMIVCGYLFLASRDIIGTISWIPMLLFGLYFAIVNFACAPIPLALVGEIFPLEHRAAGTTIAGISVALSTITTLKSVPYLLATVKVYGTFFIFGLVMIGSLMFLYFLLPETKDRTLVEIEYYFNNGRFKENSEKKEEAEVVMLSP